MIARSYHYAVVSVGVLLFIAVMVYPAGALLVRAFSSGDGPPVAGVIKQISATFPWSLLCHSVLLAAGGAALAVAISIPGAYVVGRLGRKPGDALVLALLLAPVLFPAMVYAFGWQRLMPGSGAWCCVWVWASWSWPIPALLIGAGWSRLGRSLYQEALIFTTPMQAFGRAVLPILGAHAGAGFFLLFAFFLGEYSVPHACGTLVYATALLSHAESSSNPLETVVASAPVVGVIIVTLSAALWAWRRRPRDEAVETNLATPITTLTRLIPIGFVVACIAVPVYGLARSEPLIASLRSTVETYGKELVESISIALLSGVVAMFMGACLASVGRLRNVVLGGALVWAALPGALVGEAVVIGYLPIPFIYDHWPLMAMGYVARFGWVGILISWLAYHNVGSEQIQAARVDGAGTLAIAWRIALASNWAMLACGVMVVMALCLSEVATTSLVRVPSIDSVALILIEKFHRFEDGILTALSLLLMAAAIPGAILAGVAARGQR